MNGPTDAQIEKFWELCGLRHRKEGKFDYWYNSIDILESIFTPPIDLNNLFKYAVPEILKEHTLIESYSFKQAGGLYYSETCIWDKNERQLKGKLVGKAFAQDFDLEKANALALFWAIWEVK